MPPAFRSPLLCNLLGGASGTGCIEANANVGNRTCPLCRVEWQTLPMLRPQNDGGSPRAMPFNSQQNITRVPLPLNLQPSITRNRVRRTSAVPMDSDSDGQDDEAAVSFADDEIVEVTSVVPVAAIVAQPNLTIQQETMAVPALVSRDMTAVITVKAISSETQSESARPGVDIVALLDVSGSMSGEKIALLRSTLLAAVDLLGANDRLSIVKFESTARRLSTLSRMNETGKQASRQEILRLTASGGTDIADALKVGLKIVQERRYKNPVCSVLLLTDGEDPDAHSSYRPLVSQLRNAGAIVSTFGYGNDHDARLLEGIAETGGGIFTYIANLDAVRRSFGRCMGSLLSVAAQSVVLSLRPHNGASIRRVIADGAQTPAPDGGMDVGIGEMFADLGRDLLVELTLPALHAARGDPQAYLEATLSWLPPGGTEGMRQRAPASVVEVSRPGEISAQAAAALAADPAAQEARKAVDRQRNRVMAVEAIEAALTAGDTGRLDEARNRLKEAAQRVERSDTSGEGLCQALIRDLKKTAALMDDGEQYTSQGSAMLRSKRLNHQRQRSFGSDESPYTTAAQRLCSDRMSPGVSPSQSPQSSPRGAAPSHPARPQTAPRGGGGGGGIKAGPTAAGPAGTESKGVLRLPSWLSFLKRG